VVNGGTILRMSGMNKILDISNGTVTAEAGAPYIDVAKELEKQKLQFYVNMEIGNLSVGSAACCGAKDSSMPGSLDRWAPMSAGSKWRCLRVIFWNLAKARAACAAKRRAA
jgi:FAD binding domain